VIVGMVLAVKLPKIYEASTLILVQPQRVPEKIVTSPRIYARLSRARLKHSPSRS